MIRVSVLYPDGSGKRFDMDYYANHHIPLLVRLLQPQGLIKVEIDRGLGTTQPGAPAPFVAVTHLYFPSVDAFQQALAPHAAEILGDVPNYTDIEPVVQISDIVLE